MSRRNKKEMAEITKKIVSLIIANDTLSDDAVAKHYGVSGPTVAKIRTTHHAEIEGRVGVEDGEAGCVYTERCKEIGMYPDCKNCTFPLSKDGNTKFPDGVEPAEAAEPAWVDRHSVNCYFCHTLFDEREGFPADELNGNDGGTACPKCFKERHKEDEMETKTDSKGRDISKVPENFGHHVILYAKHWYGSTGNIIADLKDMLAMYSGIELRYISDRDIYGLIAGAFAECVRNPHDIEEAIMEMLGKKWSPPFERFNGTPEVAMLGKLSIVDGCYCDPSQMLKIKFEPPKAKQLDGSTVGP